MGGGTPAISRAARALVNRVEGPPPGVVRGPIRAPCSDRDPRGNPEPHPRYHLRQTIIQTHHGRQVPAPPSTHHTCLDPLLCSC